MIRKVVQIALGIYKGSGAMALCDDGTMWFMDAPHSTNSTWCQIANVPQEETPVFCKTTYQELIEAGIKWERKRIKADSRKAIYLFMKKAKEKVFKHKVDFYGGFLDKPNEYLGQTISKDFILLEDLEQLAKEGE